MTSRSSRGCSPSVASSVAREAAHGTGSSSGVWATLIPIPRTTASPATSPSTPATLRFAPHPSTCAAPRTPTTTSLGHFARATRPNAPTARTAASAPSRLTQPNDDGGTPGRSRKLTVSEVPAGVCQSRPARPRPDSWWSATSTEKSGHASGSARTAAPSSALVEPARARTSRRATRSPSRASSAAASRAGCSLVMGPSSPTKIVAEPRAVRTSLLVRAASRLTRVSSPGTPQPTSPSAADKLADLRARLAAATEDETARERQHARGKKSARERIAALLDEGSFTELDTFVAHRATAFGMDARKPAGDGVVVGYGTVDGRPVAVYSQDFTVFGGSLGEAHGQKITKVMDLALRTGMPLVGILDGGGARIQEGVSALTQFAEIFRRNVAASGVVPQISIILGPSAGGAVYSPALTDFVVMADQTSNMFITGPDVIRAVTGEDVGFEELGGATTHNTRSGVAHYLASDEDDAIDWVKALLGYLPSNNLSEAPTFPHEDTELAANELDLELDSLVPDSDNQPYDMRTVVTHVLDDGELLEVQSLFAPNVLVGFGHVEGHPVGIVANQPQQMAGTLDINAAEKAARFVRTCDAFNIPVLTFVDVPGFLPGTDQEWNGIIRRGAKLIYAYAEATVPLVTVITRKAYGGAYIVMGSKQLGADVNLAWPTAQIAVMGAGGAVNILQRRALAAVEAAGGDVEAERARLVAEYEEEIVGPWLAAERGYVDAVIEPSQTRSQVVRALRVLRTKRASLPPKKHGNIPL